MIVAGRAQKFRVVNDEVVGDAVEREIRDSRYLDVAILAPACQVNDAVDACSGDRYCDVVGVDEAAGIEMQIAADPGAAEVHRAVRHETVVQPDVAADRYQIREQGCMQSLGERITAIFRVTESRASEVEIQADFRMIEYYRANRLKPFAHAQIVANEEAAGADAPRMTPVELEIRNLSSGKIYGLGEDAIAQHNRKRHVDQR